MSFFYEIKKVNILLMFLLIFSFDLFANENILKKETIEKKISEISTIYLIDRLIAEKKIEEFYILKNKKELEKNIKNYNYIINVYIKLINICMYLNDLESVYYYALLGESASKNNNNYKLEYFLHSKATYEDHKDDFKKAEKIYLSALSVAIQNNNQDFLIKIYISLAEYYSYAGDLKKSLKYYKKAEIYSSTIVDLLNIKLGKANLYYNLSMRTAAIEELRESESIILNAKLDLIDKNYFKGIIFQTLSILYSETKNYDLEYQYSMKALNLSKKIGDMYYESDALNSLAFYYLNKNDINNVKKYLKLSEKIINIPSFDDLNIYNNYLIIKYKFLLKINENEKALEIINKLSELKKEEPKSIKYSIYLHYSNVYKALGDYKKALENIKKFNKLNIEIKNESRKSLLLLLSDLYKDSSFNNKNLNLQKEKNKINSAISMAHSNEEKLLLNININILLFLLLSMLFYVLFRLYKKNKRFSLTDSLTKIPNRKNILNKSKKLLDKNKEVSFLLFDIDYFKKINDNYGHSIGDEILKEFSKLIKKELRKKDFFARIGGEEFLLLIDGNENVACNIAERLRLLIESHVFIKDIKITTSIGLSHNKNIKNINKLLQKADQNLYKAKNSGRNKIIY